MSSLGASFHAGALTPHNAAVAAGQYPRELQGLPGQA